MCAHALLRCNFLNIFFFCSRKQTLRIGWQGLKYAGLCRVLHMMAVFRLRCFARAWHAYFRMCTRGNIKYVHRIELWCADNCVCCKWIHRSTANKSKPYVKFQQLFSSEFRNIFGFKLFWQTFENSCPVRSRSTDNQLFCHALTLHRVSWHYTVCCSSVSPLRWFPISATNFCQRWKGNRLSFHVIARALTVTHVLCFELRNFNTETINTAQLDPMLFEDVLKI